MRLNYFSFEFTYPISKEPEWAAKVERWYQLDAPAYGLTELYWRNRTSLPDSPEWIFLASPGASNPTDAQFAKSAAPSPAKFVHTLPNIRSAPLLQVMNWSGPVLCLQNGANTLLSSLAEAYEVMGKKPVWVVGVTLEGSVWTAHIFVLGADGHLKIGKTPAQELAKSTLHDKDWLTWLKQGNQQPEPFVAAGLEVRL